MEEKTDATLAQGANGSENKAPEGEAKQTQPQGNNGESTGKKDETPAENFVSKEKYEADLKQARDMQSIADKGRRVAERKLQIALKRNAGGDNQGGQPNAEPASSIDYSEDEKKSIMDTAERKVLNLIAFEPKYQDVLSKDQTLKDIISRNPLALITEFIDAEDAVDQIKDMLDSRVSQANSSGDGGSKQQPQGEEKDPTPGPGGETSKNVLTPEQAAKMSNAEYAKLSPEVRRRLKGGESVTL